MNGHRPPAVRPPKDQIVFVVEGSISSAKIAMLAASFLLGFGLRTGDAVMALARFAGL